jgi:hypothetical protein
VNSFGSNQGLPPSLHSLTTVVDAALFLWDVEVTVSWKGKKRENAKPRNNKVFALRSLARTRAHHHPD